MTTDLDKTEKSASPNQPQEPEPSREASRELDALVAETVLGWKRPSRQYEPWDMAPDTTPGCCLCTPFALPHFSTDIAAALDALAQLGGRVVITRVNPAEWQVQFDGRRGWWAETLPLAICRAVLAAVEAQ